MLRKFIRGNNFGSFEKKCLQHFDDGWSPSISQPGIATYSNDGTPTQAIYILLIEKEVEKNTKREF